MNYIDALLELRGKSISAVGYVDDGKSIAIVFTDGMRVVITGKENAGFYEARIDDHPRAAVEFEIDQIAASGKIVESGVDRAVMNRVEEVEERRKQRNRCLDARICPKCGSKLDRKVTDDENLPDEIFKCTGCDFKFERPWA